MARVRIGTFAASICLASVLTSGCSSEAPPPVAEVQEPPTPEPLELRAPRPVQVTVDWLTAQSEEELNEVREGELGAARAQAQFVCEGPSARRSQGCVESSQAPRRLIFECTDGVTFAVRMNDRSLILYPPGFPPNSSLTLAPVPSEPGVVHYQISDIDFRSKGDVATLEMGRERYIDCVANPAASVWQDPRTLNSEQLEQRLRAVEQPRP